MTTSAGVTEAFSDAISVSHLAVGSARIAVLDGLTDSRYQSDAMTLTARWDLSEEPCPFLRTDWAIMTVDGRYVQNFTDMKG